MRFVLALKAAGLRIAATSSSSNTRPFPRDLLWQLQQSAFRRADE